MPLYRYQAFDRKSKKLSGLIDAHHEQEAKTKLRSQGVLVVKLTLKKGSLSKENLKGDKLLTFTIQLSQLVNAGVPVFESLIALEEQYRQESFHRVILSLCEQVKAGTPLSEAMRHFPNTFDRLYCSMTKAGESAGALDLVLERLSVLLTKQNKMKKEIFTAMIYPSILAGFSLLVIILLLGFVVPSIEGIFADKSLNTFTRLVINTSHFFRDYWWSLPPAIGGVAVWLITKFRTSQGRIWLERRLMRLPLIRTLLIQAAVARFCRTMGTLQRGGLTMIESLRISREVMKNATLEEDVAGAEKRIIEGSSLSAEFARSRWIPHIVPRMLAVGEDSGTLVAMLEKLADMYEENLEKTLNRVMALSQPVILIVMGTVIGTVLMAILLPLTDMSSFAL
ncbi:MAG: type II secretion system F family protein [Waddliaceae bacterium]